MKNEQTIQDQIRLWIRNRSLLCASFSSYLLNGITRRNSLETPPEAIQLMKDAVEKMKRAGSSLAERKRDPALPAEENALADLKDLQAQLRDLIQNQEKLKGESAAAEPPDLLSKAPRQGEMRDKAQDLQKRAASPSPPTA